MVAFQEEAEAEAGAEEEEEEEEDEGEEALKERPPRGSRLK